MVAECAPVDPGHEVLFPLWHLTSKCLHCPSQEVREQAVEIIRRIPGRERRDYVEQMLPFVRAGLTHLAANVASTSLDLLQWLVDYCGEELVSCRGGWVKTLKCFLVMLRWTSETRRSGWTFSKSSMGDQTYQAGSLVKCIEVLESFLRAGLSRPREDRVPMSNFPRFPLAGTLGAHIPTNTAGGYSCLDLFGETLDDENAECHDVETRKRILAENFQPALEQGLAALLADGGHIGLAAKEAAEVLQKGMGNALGHDGYGSNEELGDIPEDEEPRAEGSQGGDAQAEGNTTMDDVHDEGETS